LKRLNEIARNAGYKGDFFETNLAAVMDKYVGSYAEQMGMIARKKYLVDKGIFKKLERVDKVDKDAVKALRKSMAETAANRSNAGKSCSEECRRHPKDNERGYWRKVEER